MKVFISWSGKRSKAVGELLDEWLKCVLQVLNPWMSSKDVDRGSLWFSEIGDQLKDTSIGIICLTTTNIDKPWILFEAGALVKGLSSSRVCTFLVDLTPADIGDPLAQFNHTLPDENGVWSLVSTLNSLLGDNKLSDKILENVFKTYWPQFEESFSKIIKETKDDNKVVTREENDILLEVLSVTRTLDRRIRNIENDNERNLIYNRSIDYNIKNNRGVNNSLDIKDRLSNRKTYQGLAHQEIMNAVLESTACNSENLTSKSKKYIDGNNNQNINTDFGSFRK